MSEFSKLNGYDIKDKKAIRTFDTVADMKADENLKVGQCVATLGYYSVNDGGGALYNIKTSSNEYYEQLNNSLVAELIIQDSVNIKMLGAYGNAVNDDSEKLQYAVDNFNEIIIPTGTFLISSDIDIVKTCNIKGLARNKSIIKLTNNASLLFNNAYINIMDLEILLDTDYLSSAIKLLTPSKVVGRVIENILIIGTNHTGNGIEVTGENSNGTMNDIISNVTFNKLNAGIYINVDQSGWNSALKVENCWEWSCIYGMYWNEESANTNNLYISNFKGQYTPNVSVGLIYNLKGNSCTVDNCFMWDGGITLLINKNSNFTIVRSISVVDKAKFIDHGFRTRISFPDIQTNNGRYYDYKDNFFGNVLSKYSILTSEGATVTNELITPGTGLMRAGIKLSTGNITNNYAIFKLGMTCLNETAPWTIDFDLNISDLTNVELYCGGCIVDNNNPQGNFISLNTAISNKLQAVDRGSSGIVTSIDLLENNKIFTNNWLHCQIKYLSQTSCLFYINGNYIGEIDPHRYNQQPYFYIKTLEDVDKTLSIANLYFDTYIY